MYIMFGQIMEEFELISAGPPEAYRYTFGSMVMSVVYTNDLWYIRLPEQTSEKVHNPITFAEYRSDILQQMYSRAAELVVQFAFPAAVNQIIAEKVAGLGMRTFCDS